MFEALSSNSAIATSIDYSLTAQGFFLPSIDQITPNVLQNQSAIIAGVGDDDLLGLKVNEGLAVSKALLTDFAASPGFTDKLQIAFGDEFDRGIAQGVGQQWASDSFGDLPPIQVVGSEVLGGANGAFAISMNRIYLSREFIGSQGLGAVVSVILEETGHYLDSRINRFDAAGDEGDIFAHLVQGNSLSGGELDSLRQEDDHGFIDVNNQSITVEFQVKTGQANSDVNGDGMDDIVGFGDGAVFVSLSNGNGTFQNAIASYPGYLKNNGFTTFDDYPRMLADVNGDGKADIVGLWCWSSFCFFK